MTVTGLTCLQLNEIDLSDPGSILAFVNAAGTAGFGGGPDEQAVAEFVLGATVVRDAVSAWRVLRSENGESGARDVEWHLPRLVTVDDEELPAAAAEYLNDLLASGLSSFSPTLAVSVDVAGEEPVLDLNLHTLCCLELFNHVAGGDVFARCANESCGRLFVLDERGRRRGMRYCASSGGVVLGASRPQPETSTIQYDASTARSASEPARVSSARRRASIAPNAGAGTTRDGTVATASAAIAKPSRR